AKAGRQRRNRSRLLQFKRRGITTQLALQLHAVLTVFIEGHRVVVGQHVVGMAFEKVYLYLQFARIGPVVVSFAIGDVATASHAEQARHRRLALGVLIHFAVEGANQVRETFGVVSDD